MLRTGQFVWLRAKNKTNKKKIKKLIHVCALNPQFTAADKKIWCSLGRTDTSAPPDNNFCYMLRTITLVNWPVNIEHFLIDWINCVSLFGQLRIPSLVFLLCWPVGVRGNNPLMLSRWNTKTEREREADSRLKPNWHKQTTSKWRLLFIWRREKGGERGKKREKIYLICNCQESIFTCKIASEWERLPRGRNMTAFTRVRMDHHLQPPPPPSCLSFSLHRSIFISLALCFPPSFLPFSPPLPFPLILFSDSITLHFDNPAA